MKYKSKYNLRFVNVAGILVLYEVDDKRKAVYVRYIIDGRRDVRNVLERQLLLNPMNNNLEHRRVVPVFF